MSHPKDAGFGGKLHPDRPRKGDRFRVAGRNEVLVVEEVEGTFNPADKPTSFLVRTAIGTRWTLVSRDGVLDGINYRGTPLPADPQAPTS